LCGGPPTGRRCRGPAASAGEVGFFLYIKFFVPTKFFTQIFFSFDFDAIFFILSIFSDAKFFTIFFYSECKKKSKISQFLSLKFLFLIFFLVKKFSLSKISLRKNF